MTYEFGRFVLDPRRFELRADGATVAAEPQVLSMLLLLIDHRDRLVTKDELIEAIWNSRAISDSAISSRLKTARQLIGDDGRSQRLIRTVHGKGFRFVGEVHQSTEFVVPGVRRRSDRKCGCCEPAAVDRSAAVQHRPDGRKICDHRRRTSP